jgi:hypothetical protein
MEKDKKFAEKKCLRCQRYFRFPKDVEPSPHLCPVCANFFRKFNSKEKVKK